MKSSRKQSVSALESIKKSEKFKVFLNFSNFLLALGFWGRWGGRVPKPSKVRKVQENKWFWFKNHQKSLKSSRKQTVSAPEGMNKSEKFKVFLNFSNFLLAWGFWGGWGRRVPKSTKVRQVQENKHFWNKNHPKFFKS